MDKAQLQAGVAVLVRSLAALAAGGLTGVVLCLAIALGPDALAAFGGKAHRIVPLAVEFAVGAAVAGYHAVAICAVGALIWQGLIRIGRDTPLDAAVLGLVLTVAAWMAFNFGSSTLFSLDALRLDGLFGAAGAISGLVTWFAARRLGLHRRLVPAV